MDKKVDKLGLRMKKLGRFDADYTESPNFPKELFFDVTNACNHTCFFCANSTSNTPSTLINTSLIFRLLEEASELGVTDVGLYATGEPFLNKKLALFVKKAKELGIPYVFISSNGALATPDRAKPVLDAGLDSIKFSVNGGWRETYKSVHGADEFDLVLTNIKWFHEYRGKSGLKFKMYVSFVESSKNEGEWENLVSLLSPFVDELDHRHCSNQGGNMYQNNQTEDINPENLLGSLLPGQFHEHRCPDPFNRMTITPQGYATVCVVDYENYLTVADLNHSSLEAAWNSDNFKELRKRHIQGNLDGLICKNCLFNTNEVCTPLMPSLATSKKNNIKI